MDGQVVAVEENAADGLAQRGAARIAAGHDVATLRPASHWASNWICVDFPLPSGPSMERNMPRLRPGVTAVESATVHCKGIGVGRRRTGPGRATGRRWPVARRGRGWSGAADLFRGAPVPRACRCLPGRDALRQKPAIQIGNDSLLESSHHGLRSTLNSFLIFQWDFYRSQFIAVLAGVCSSQFRTLSR